MFSCSSIGRTIYQPLVRSYQPINVLRNSISSSLFKHCPTIHQNLHITKNVTLISHRNLVMNSKSNNNEQKKIRNIMFYATCAALIAGGGGAIWLKREYDTKKFMEIISEAYDMDKEFESGLSSDEFYSLKFKKALKFCEWRLINPHKGDIFNQTVLHHIIGHGKVDDRIALATLLLNRGAKIDQRDGGCGSTALHLAVIRNDPVMFKWLIEQGADMSLEALAPSEKIKKLEELINQTGKLFHSSEPFKPFHPKTIYEMASIQMLSIIHDMKKDVLFDEKDENKFESLAERFLEEYNEIDPSLLEKRNNCGQSLLHIAAKHGNVSLIKKLISMNAIVDDKDGLGLTPYFIAAFFGHAHAMMALRENGADGSLEYKNKQATKIYKELFLRMPSYNFRAYVKMNDSSLNLVLKK